MRLKQRRKDDRRQVWDLDIVNRCGERRHRDRRGGLDRRGESNRRPVPDSGG